ncbi:hypothetical protein [Aequorivita antarctica]|uniref:Uncharacterized protein n=1 Tax=Aequorivita antarctica TaxID=153266 RepID=A0A5C6Z4R0_9FLAO|nr:hypothetical protein [Aequorivita antarctica]TXD74443.1 hypothetical protein ESU54_04120 [Aequorivita antarctica]
MLITVKILPTNDIGVRCWVFYFGGLDTNSTSLRSLEFTRSPFVIVTWVMIQTVIASAAKQSHETTCHHE